MLITLIVVACAIALAVYSYVKVEEKTSNKEDSWL